MIGGKQPGFQPSMENCDQSFLIQLHHRLVNFESSFSPQLKSLFGLMGDMSPIELDDGKIETGKPYI